MTIRDNHKKATDFTDRYFNSGLVLVVKKDDPIPNVEDLKDKTILVKQGSSGLAKAKGLANQYGAKVKILEDEATAYMDIQNGVQMHLFNDSSFVAVKIKFGTATDLKIAPVIGRQALFSIYYSTPGD